VVSISAINTKKKLRLENRLSQFSKEHLNGFSPIREISDE
jgi:hypothetical protein